MSLADLPKFVQDLLHKISKENEFHSYSVNVGSGLKAGDGFSGQLFKITISEDNGDKTLNLVIKVPPTNETRRKEFVADMQFIREAQFYGKFLPILIKFQNEKRVPINEQFLSFPKCYATVADCEREQFTIILENLQTIGFSMWDLKKPSLVENVRLAMKVLGKFHGLSVAMKHQKPEEFTEFKQLEDFFTDVFQSKNIQAIFTVAYDRAIKSLKSEDHKNVMRDIRDNFSAYIEDCFDRDASERFAVLCHGDFWNNNMMFKFNESGIAEDIRCLDFQHIHYISPAIDIFTSTDKAFRDKEFDNMLRTYHESLCEMVKLLGSNPNELFTFDDLQNELKRRGNFALILAPFSLQVSQADPSELINMDEIFDKKVDENDKPEIITGLSDKGQLEYERRLNEVFDDIINLGYYRQIK